MCSTDCAYDSSAIIIIGDVYCPNTKCLRNFCLHKKTFQSLGRSDYQCPQCASVCQVRNVSFEDQTNSFFLSFGAGVFEESVKLIPKKMLLEMCIVLASIVSTERNANLLVVI